MSRTPLNNVVVHYSLPRPTVDFIRRQAVQLDMGYSEYVNWCVKKQMEEMNK